MRKTFLFFVLCLTTTLTWSQTKTGTGPSDGPGDLGKYADELIIEVKKNFKSCEMQDARIANILDLYVYYSLNHSLQKDLYGCEEPDELPSRLTCAFQGKAREALSTFVSKKDSLESMRIILRNKYSMRDIEVEPMLNFFNELDRKLKKNEKK